MQNQLQNRRRKTYFHLLKEKTRSALSQFLQMIHCTQFIFSFLNPIIYFLCFYTQVPSDADLKEHMVGIIFSRSKLTNLQKQVDVY